MTKFPFGNELVAVERGELITSETKLAEKWGWSRHKVRDFLELLQSDSMLVKKSDVKRTRLKVLNYSVWQDSRTDKEQKKDSSGTAEGQLRDTNKNVKNEKNEKNIKDLSLEIENFRQRYDGETLKNIDQYFDILRTTRVSGKISDSIVRNVYKEMEKHPPVVVKAAVLTVIHNPNLHSKKENYFFGIMRNTKADEAEQKIQKYEQPQRKEIQYEDFTGIGSLSPADQAREILRREREHDSR